MTAQSPQTAPSGLRGRTGPEPRGYPSPRCESARRRRLAVQRASTPTARARTRLGHACANTQLGVRSVRSVLLARQTSSCGCLAVSLPAILCISPHFAVCTLETLDSTPLTPSGDSGWKWKPASSTNEYPCCQPNSAPMHLLHQRTDISWDCCNATGFPARVEGPANQNGPPP